MRGPLPRRPCVADSAATGMELPEAHRTGPGAGRREDSCVEAEALAGVKKNAKNEGRTIVFIDESGLSQRPHRCRTWAPRGPTPVLQYHFNWKSLSVAAVITVRNFNYCLFSETLTKAQVIDCLLCLVRYLRMALHVMCDWLMVHLCL